MESTYEKPLFHNCVWDRDGIWFWDFTQNGLFYAKEHKGQFEAELRCLYRDYELCEVEEELFTAIAKWENKLVLIPGSADELMLYDIDSGSREYVAFPEEKGLINEKGKFWGNVLCHNTLYLIGYFTAYVVEVNLLEKRTTNLFRLQEKNDDVCVYYKNAILKDSELYIPDCRTNRVFIINIESSCVSEKWFSNTKDGFSYIAWDKERGLLWLSPRKEGAIVSYDAATGEENYYDEYPVEYNAPKGRATLGFMAIYCNTIIILPLLANSVLEMKGEDTCIRKHTKLSEVLKIDDEIYQNVQKVMCMEQFDNLIYIYSRINREWIVYDIKKDSFQKLSIRFTERISQYIKSSNLKKYYRNNSVYYENQDYSLQELLTVL